MYGLAYCEVDQKLNWLAAEPKKTCSSELVSALDGMLNSRQMMTVKPPLSPGKSTRHERG